MKTSRIVCVVLSLVVVTFSVSACRQSSDTSKKIEIKQDEEDNIKIDNNNAEAIDIEKVKFDNVDKDLAQKKLTKTKIENKSIFNTSNIKLVYSEYDKNGNLISSDSNAFLGITLLPGDTAYVELEHKEFANIIEITSYSYTAEGKRVNVNLKNDKIDIKKASVITENSKSYETLVLSDFKKLNDAEDGNTYRLKVKNSSSKDLGNLILKVAELNENGDYINLEHIAYNSVLKASEETEIDVISSIDARKLKVVGYIYNDTDQNINVDIDFNSHRAIVD
ncbi:hypothetical protein KQI18_00745 [Clostridioides mangenotii]|uniref:hypothetical protein n=1 Tax=Metaclostridioides mangenotii TaxID=1540 RepID=UPI001C120B1D|nr:hypothetical protein [Clostridioides mangenotii]MBU5306300.1 hypothetical protein [Clostridioides mangenotii]